MSSHTEYDRFGRDNDSHVVHAAQAAMNEARLPLRVRADNVTREIRGRQNRELRHLTYHGIVTGVPIEIYGCVVTLGVYQRAHQTYSLRGAGSKGPRNISVHQLHLAVFGTQGVGAQCTTDCQTMLHNN